MKRTLTAMLVSLGPFASGCATEQASRVEAPYVPDRDQTVRVVRCEDRTGTQTGRDLAREATQHLVEKLQDAKLFQVADDASLVLTCDIERFEEGSALKRWLMPGWGATQADIAVMAWRQPGDQILATFRSHAHVDAGGLYTIGADRYILSVALDDIVGQLRQWRAGTPPQGGAQK